MDGRSRRAAEAAQRRHGREIHARAAMGMLYAERHPTRSAAMSREWHLKRDKAFRKGLRE
jgi:predicted GIY-YIG superfamily endonuclease